MYGNVKKKIKFRKLSNLLLNEQHNFPNVNLKNINIKNPNTNEKNNSIKIIFNVGKFNPIVILHLLFVSHIYDQLFYNKMRVEKQLGYLVHIGYSKIGDYYYIYEKIQSEVDNDQVEKYINEFNSLMVNELVSKDFNLESWKNTITSFLKEKKNSTFELFNKYLNEIMTRKYMFNRHKKLLRYIDKVTVNSLTEFINKYIVNSENKYIIKINKN
jgi:secreted Zn-dependent insulinase-like peptidase